MSKVVSEELKEDLKRCGIKYDKVLGQGTYGTVLQVGNRALKYMDIDNLSKLTSAVVEIAIAKQYRFPHFLPYLGGIFYGDKSEPYCTSQGLGYYMPMAKGDFYSLNGNEILNSYYGVLNALADMHFYHLTHNDIKPANMLTSQIKGYMSDLGSIVISKDFKDSPRTTYMFAAPEVYEENKCEYKDTCKYNTQADMWAMGMSLFSLAYDASVLFFETLEQHRKFYKDMKVFSLSQYKINRWAIPYKEKLDDFFNKVLLIDPSKRLTAEEALTHSLFADMEEEDPMLKQPYTVTYKVNVESDMIKIINSMGPALAYFPYHEDLPILILDYIYRFLSVRKLGNNDPISLIQSVGFIICSLLNINLDKSFYSYRPSVSVLLSYDIPFYNDNLLSLCKNSREKAYLYKKYYCQPKAFYSLVGKRVILPIIKEDTETMEMVYNRITMEI